MKESIEQAIGYIMSLIKLELQTKLQLQGHGTKGSSKLIDTMEWSIKRVATLYVADFLMEEYGVFVDKGVTASRIPFNQGSGKKVSKYITGLYNFWLKKGLNAKEAKSASFALAKKHKKEGMPTRSSFRFSKDNSRLKFQQTTLLNIEDRIFSLLEDNLGKSFEIHVITLLDNFAKTVK